MSVVIPDPTEHISTNPGKDNNGNIINPNANDNNSVIVVRPSNQQLRSDENEDGINHRASLTYQNKVQLLQIFLHLRPLYLDPTMSKASFWQRVNDEISRMLDIPFKSSVYTIKRLVKRRKAQLAHQQKYIAAGAGSSSGNVSNAVFRKVALDELVDKVIQVFQEERALKRKADSGGDNSGRVPAGISSNSSGGAAGSVPAAGAVLSEVATGLPRVGEDARTGTIEFPAIMTGSGHSGPTVDGVEQLFEMVGSMRRALDHQTKVIDQQSKIMELLVKEVKDLREALPKWIDCIDCSLFHGHYIYFEVFLYQLFPSYFFKLGIFHFVFWALPIFFIFLFFPFLPPPTFYHQPTAPPPRLTPRHIYSRP